MGAYARHIKRPLSNPKNIMSNLTFQHQFNLDALREYLSQHPPLIALASSDSSAQTRHFLHHSLNLPEQSFFTINANTPLPSAINQLKTHPQAAQAPLLAAISANGKTHLLSGKQSLITPSDSLAILADHHRAIPPLHNLTGVARSLPTSRAIDIVAAQHQFTCYQTPTGWQYFPPLLQANLIQLCGEENFALSGHPLEEKNSLWALLCWFSLLAQKRQNADQILQNHWQRYGKHHHKRFDFTNLQKSHAQTMLTTFERNSHANIGNRLNGLTLTAAQQFNYTDPTNQQQSQDQGLQLIFGRQARIICRLTSRPTHADTTDLRLYCEYWQQHLDTPPVLTAPTATLATLAQGMMNLEHHQPNSVS